MTGETTMKNLIAALQVGQHLLDALMKTDAGKAILADTLAAAPPAVATTVQAAEQVVTDVAAAQPAHPAKS